MVYNPEIYRIADLPNTRLITNLRYFAFVVLGYLLQVRSSVLGTTVCLRIDPEPVRHVV